MGKFILSGFSDEFDRNFTEQVKGMANYGIGYLEVRFVGAKNIADLTREEVAELKADLDTYGIKVSAIGSPLGKIRLDEDMDAHMETAKRVFETANTLGTKLIRIFSFYPPEGKNIDHCRDDVFAGVDKLLNLADEFGVVLCHENEARVYGQKPENCLDLMKHFGGRLKVVLDMGNFTLENHNPYTAYQMLKEHIAYFHIKDGLAGGSIVPPGKGDARIADILADYAKTMDKDVFVSLEPHLRRFSGLKNLTDSTFAYPYTYDTPQDAFTDAVVKMREILKGIQ
ncbi:MAG: sugar phosphate isomerase/epimerase [Clostridia bacterium]|nr:sugar phosphate isomerase/epimerase [Clostridia bacterium]